MTTQLTIAPDYTPRQWALPAHRSNAKRKVLWVHRRGGKGWFALHEGLAAYGRSLSMQPDADLVPGFHAWTVAPTYPQARQSESEIEAFLPAWARPASTEWDQSRGHSRADNLFRLLGSQYRREGLWEVKSAHEPEALQTVGLDFLHVQECQDIHENAFIKLLPTLRSPGRMGLSVWEGIPPDDPGHWFARLLAEAEEDTMGVSEAFRVPYTENPDLDDQTKAEIEKDLEIMLEREWRRMYMVELPMGSGAFLGDVDGCITSLPLLDEPEEGHRYVMGLDLAKKVDFTVIIVMDACHRRVVWHRRIGQMDWPVQEEAIGYASERFGVGRIKVDSTGVGDPLFDRLRYGGYPVEPFLFTNESKYRLLTGLAVGIEKHAISYPSVSIMLRELKGLHAVRLPSGRSRIEASGGGHDDYPMSLALAYSLCDMPEMDMSKWADVKPSRYAPVYDTMRPGGVPVAITRRNGYREKRKEIKREARVKELEQLGFEL